MAYVECGQWVSVVIKKLARKKKGSLIPLD